MFTVYVCPCYVVHPLVTHHGNSLRQSPCCAMCSQVAKSNLGKSIPGAWQILITRALWRLVDSAHCISWITTSFWKKMMFCVWKNHKNVNHNLSVLFELDNLDIWCPKMTPPFASPKHPTTLPLCAFCRSLNAMYLLAKAVMKTSASEAEILKKAIRNKKEDKKFCFQHFVFQNHPKSKSFQIFIQAWNPDVSMFHWFFSFRRIIFFLSHWAIQAKKIFRKGARDARKLGLTKQALAFMQDLGLLAEVKLWCHDVTKILVVTLWSVEKTLLLVPGKLCIFQFSTMKLVTCCDQNPPMPITILIQSRLEAFCCRARVNCWKRRNSSNECYEVRDGSLSGVKVSPGRLVRCFLVAGWSEKRSPFQSIKNVKPCVPWFLCFWKWCARPWWVVGQFSSWDP